MEFSSNRVAYNMIKYYKIMAGEKDPLKIVFDSETDPLKQKGSSIVIRHNKGQGDVGVFKGGDKEIAVCLPTQHERDAFQHLFDGSSDIVRTY
ncbi:hypothetical protein [Candidatus Tisiphia endosymbiont of Oplodontha viridula]|uniref:hypothetical protein n=1 Tax=Candidatus Tisiphia endosymbiont of Oplodontha viridula TaxID=3077925 RepID=UPI0035C92AFF